MFLPVTFVIIFPLLEIYSLYLNEIDSNYISNRLSLCLEPMITVNAVLQLQPIYFHKLFFVPHTTHISQNYDT